LGVKELFSRFARSDGRAPSERRPSRRAEGIGTPTNVVRIDYDMMIKGSVYDRPGGPVKQYGVTVGGATRVITSGDFVNEATYRALLTAGAIRPREQGEEAPPPPGQRGKRRAG